VPPFDQSAAACRFEWGVNGHDHLAPSHVTMNVEVLSFSTCVDIATTDEKTAVPVPTWKCELITFVFK